MPGVPRPLPSRPSLRYLKLEAKRRLAAGEFPALHDAQEAIAKEHGRLGWAALKEYVTGQREQDSPVRSQLDWVITRFRDADGPAWKAPDEHELRQHFSAQVLAALSASQLVAALASIAPDLRADLVVMDQAPLGVRAQLGSSELYASAEAEPPHLLTGVRLIPLGSRMADPRVTAPPPTRTLGAVPEPAAAIAAEAFTGLGLAGLILAGGGPGLPPWAVAMGWANLERAEILDPGHRIPALGVTALVTITAVLRLVADGRFDLATPARDHLRTVRLADDSITVRELLSYTSGIDDIPANPSEVFAASVPELVALTGPVIGCDGPRGVVRAVNSGLAVLGQLIADVTGLPYAEAVTQLVLEPLGMSDSSFPDRAEAIGPGTVTGYAVTAAGVFVPWPAAVCVLPAAGGLWATAADLVRLGSGWASLLPATLARAALTPQASADQGMGIAGLGWIIRPRGDTAFVAGTSMDGIASLSVRIRDQRTHLVMTNRLVPVDSVDDRMLRAWTNPAHPERSTIS